MAGVNPSVAPGNALARVHDAPTTAPNAMQRSANAAGARSVFRGKMICDVDHERAAGGMGTAELDHVRSFGEWLEQHEESIRYHWTVGTRLKPEDSVLREKDSENG